MSSKKIDVAKCTTSIYFCAERIHLLANTYQARTYNPDNLNFDWAGVVIDESNVNDLLDFNGAICRDIRNSSSIIATNANLILHYIGDHTLPWPSYQDTLRIRNLHYIRLEMDSFTISEITKSLKTLLIEGVENTPLEVKAIIDEAFVKIEQNSEAIKANFGGGGDPLVGGNPKPPVMPD